jgi:diguanylate cyclase (GGDEF)-like protein/PAS domain S-box-containing protein
MPDTSLSSLFEFLPIGAYRSTPGGVQLRANAALVRLNGYASEADMLAATQALDQGWYVEPNRRATFKALMEAQGAVVNFVSEVYRHKTRERIWIRENAYAVRDEAGQVLYYEGTVEDVSDSMRAQQALADSEARWRLALEAAGDGVWDWNIATGEETCSDGLLRMFGYEPGELPNDLSALDVRTHPDDRAQMAVDRDAHLTGSSPAYVNEHRVQCKNGEWKWVLSRGMVVARNHDGQPLRMIGTHTDISGRKRAETLIWQQANFDALTGLPNRRMLRQQLDVSLLRAAQHGRPVAVAFIDLDHFKEVNDTLGHDFGDMLLVQAAQRIRQATDSSDTVARMGGDEFTVVVSDITAGDHMGDQLSQRLAALLDALSQGFELRGQTVFVSASIGVALYPTDATQVEDLFKHADQALYSAKGAGRNRFCFFTPSLQVAAQQRARLDADLRLALPLQQLEVVYQPIVDMVTGQVRKAEALLRWHHPVLGPVSPVQFIPIAESSGLIIPLGDWVFAQAVEQVAAWRHRFDAAFQISVNKSPVQFHRKASLNQKWAHQLAQRGMPGSAIAIEITEGLLLDTSPLVTDHLAELRQAGIDVSLDDFGTGYSSLTYLQKLAIDYIKIDQSFVRNLQPGSTALSLCKAIIVMAHELGMRVVAEGVETEMQRDLLLHAGCDHGQGYLFARPMSSAAFEAWMNDTGSKLSFP